MTDPLTTGPDPDWAQVADQFCAAWTSDTGRADFDGLAGFYAPDEPIVIYDALPPLEGFRGFARLRGDIYDGLSRLVVERIGDVHLRPLRGGDAVVLSYPLRYEYDFSDGRELRFDGRISQVWERQGDRFRIVHEHPSTVIED